jgi:hypothetical protein
VGAGWVRDEGGGVGGAVELCEEDGECVALLEAGRMTCNDVGVVLWRVLRLRFGVATQAFREVG